MLIDGVKFSCQACVKGHRSEKCAHADRPLWEVRKKGRPKTQCTACQHKRELTGGHAKCSCARGDDRPPPLFLPNGAVPSLSGIAGASSLHRAPSTSTNASASSTPSSIDHSEGSPNMNAVRARSVSNAAVARRKDSSASLQQQLLATKPHDLAHGHSHHSSTHSYSPYPHTSHPHSHPTSLPRSAPLTRSPSNASSAASRARALDQSLQASQNIVLNTHQTGLDTPPDLVRSGERMFELPPLRDAEQRFELPPAIKLEEYSNKDGTAAVEMPPPVPEGQYAAGEPLSFQSSGSWPAHAEPPISVPPTFNEPAGWRLDSAPTETATTDFDLSAEIDRWRHVLELEFDPSDLGAVAASATKPPLPTPPSADSSSASSLIEEWAPQQQQQQQQQFTQQQVSIPSASPSPSLFESDFPPSATGYEWQNDGGIDPWSAYRGNDGAFYSASASSSSSAAGSEYSFNLDTGSVNGTSASGGVGELAGTYDGAEYDPTLALSFADFDLSLAGPPSIVLQQQQQQLPLGDEDESDEEEERQRIRDAMARRGPSDSRLALDREETWRPGRRTPDG